MSEPLRRKNWKKVKNRRAKAWKALNRPYTPIPTSVKFSIFAVILIMLVLVPSYAYWSNNVAPYQNPPNGGCPSGHTPKNGICAVNDPYTLLWNGTVTGAGTSVTSLQVAKTQSSAPTNDVSFNSGPSTSPVTYRLMEAYCDGQFATAFTLVRIDFTVKRIGAPTGTIIGKTWSGGPFGSPNGNCADNNVAQATFGTTIDISTLSTSYQTVSFLGSFAVGTTLDYAFGVQIACTSCSPTNYITAGIVSVGGNTGENAWLNVPTDVPGNCGVPSNNAPACPTSYKYQYTLYSGLNCPLGFGCMNSGLSGSNFATLIANATFPAVMLTSSSVTVSTAASKELLFYETWGNSTVLLNNKPFAWYLTVNATLPNTPSYSPLTDPNVAMVVVVYPATSGVNNYYIYQQKDAGSAVLGASGQSQNPFPTCPQTSTLYICSQSTNVAEGSTNFLAISTLLNYTGSGGPNGVNSGVNANSLMCSNVTPANLNSGFCTTPGSPQGVNPCTAPSSGICTTNTFPFLNVQNQYYLGMWSNASQTGKVLFGTSNTGAVDKKANAVYYWIPNPSCPPTCAQTDTGGFFGWFGKTVNGAVNTVFSTIQNVATWTQNTALGPIGNVLQGMISWMITQLVNFINWVGGTFLGNSSLGTQLLTAFNNIVGIVTKVLTDFVTWFVNFGTFVQSAITTGISIFANTVIFGILGFFANQLTILFSIVLTVITTFFSYATPTSYLLMMDWIWAIMMVYVIGVSGFLWWIDLNVQIFTFVFKMMWKFIEAVWSTIIIIKSFIPTEGGTQGTVNNPIPTTGGRGGSGSQSGSQGKPAPTKPSEAKTPQKQEQQRPQPKAPKVPRGIGQGAKDGDPMAIVVMSFLIIVLFFWLSQAAFSPVATVTTAGCYAWSTNCHVQNGITVGNLDTTVFFAFLFSTQHSIFTLFTIVVPLAVVMFARWFQNNVIGEDEDGEEEGNMFFNW